MHSYTIKSCRGVSVEDRFFDRIGKKTESGCILWKGRKNKKGYGELDITSGDYQDRPVFAHRISYELFIGPIPEGMKVCHTCDNPSCLNPIHYFLGTDTENQADKNAKGRGAKGERSGRAKLTAEIVLETRSRYANGEATQHQIARELGIHQVTVSEIVLRKIWKHI